MVWITAGQSQIKLDFSHVRVLTMWLLPTTHVVCSYYTVVVVQYSCIVSDHENNQSTHIYIYEPYKNSKTFTTHLRFWRPHIYYPVLLLFRRKNK